MVMKKVFVCGANGFIGGSLIKSLEDSYDVVGIRRENYRELKNEEGDVFINANGSSKKYLAEQEPICDFDKAVKSVFSTIFDFKFEHYIYISTLDAYRDSVYGINRYLSEQSLIRHAKRLGFHLNIVRLGFVIGCGMKKGVIYDIINRKELYVTADSSFQIIPTYEIVGFIKYLVENKPEKQIFDFAATTSVTVDEISKILEVDAMIGGKSTVKQEYHYDVSDAKEIYDIKTSQEYLFRLRSALQRR